MIRIRLKMGRISINGSKTGSPAPQYVIPTPVLSEVRRKADEAKDASGRDLGLARSVRMPIRNVSARRRTANKVNSSFRVV